MITDVRSSLETGTATAAPDLAIQERINAMIAEAVKNAPLALSAEEQREKNQAALATLRQRDEDTTDRLEELVRREADWQEFKEGINENSLSGRTICPAEDYP